MKLRNLATLLGSMMLALSMPAHGSWRDDVGTAFVTPGGESLFYQINQGDSDYSVQAVLRMNSASNRWNSDLFDGLGGSANIGKPEPVIYSVDLMKIRCNPEGASEITAGNAVPDKECARSLFAKQNATLTTTTLNSLKLSHSFCVGVTQNCNTGAYRQKANWSAPQRWHDQRAAFALDDQDPKLYPDYHDVSPGTFSSYGGAIYHHNDMLEIIRQVGGPNVEIVPIQLQINPFTVVNHNVEQAHALLWGLQAVATQAIADASVGATNIVAITASLGVDVSLNDLSGRGKGTACSVLGWDASLNPSSDYTQFKNDLATLEGMGIPFLMSAGNDEDKVNVMSCFEDIVIIDGYEFRDSKPESFPNVFQHNRNEHINVAGPFGAIIDNNARPELIGKYPVWKARGYTETYDFATGGRLLRNENDVNARRLHGGVIGTSPATAAVAGAIARVLWSGQDYSGFRNGYSGIDFLHLNSLHGFYFHKNNDPDDAIGPKRGAVTFYDTNDRAAEPVKCSKVKVVLENACSTLSGGVTGRKVGFQIYNSTDGEQSTNHTVGKVVVETRDTYSDPWVAQTFPGGQESASIPPDWTHIIRIKRFTPFGDSGWCGTGYPDLSSNNDDHEVNMWVPCTTPPQNDDEDYWLDWKWWAWIWGDPDWNPNP